MRPAKQLLLALATVVVLSGLFPYHHHPHCPPGTHVVQRHPFLVCAGQTQPPVPGGGWPSPRP